MKKITKLVVLVLALFALFSFKDEIKDHWVQYFSSGQDEWVVGGMEAAKEARGQGKLDYSMKLLVSLQQEIVEQSKLISGEARQQLTAAYRSVECEMAAVYKELAVTYFNDGDSENFAKYTQFANDKLRACAGQSAIPIVSY